MRKLYLAAVLSLVGILAWLYFFPVGRPAVPGVENGKEQSDVVEEALATLDIATGFMPTEIYPEILARPVFFKERKPPEPYVREPGEKKTVAGSRSADVPPRLSLSGVVTIGKETFALVRFPGGKSSRRLKMGEEIDGWKVREITPEKLVLIHGSTKHEVPLREYDPVLPGKGAPRKVARNGAKRPPVKRGRSAMVRKSQPRRQARAVPE